MTSQASIRFGERLTRRGELLKSLYTSGPGLLWVLVFLVVPLLGLGVISFLTRGDLGGFEPPLTLESYRRFVGFGFFGFDIMYPQIVVRSFALGAGTTTLCLLAALPLAFFIASLPGRYKDTALTLVLIPFWSNLLIRTYAWQMLLSSGGWIARFAVSLHLIGPDESLCPSALAVYVGMVCDYLPFLVLPLYSSVEKIDWDLAEAASDLGANSLRVFWHAVLPQIVPGMVAGVTLVFIPATGQFVIPDLLGGAKTIMVGNVIQQQFGGSRDWPFGSAISFVLMGLVLTSLWVYASVTKDNGREIL